MPHTEMTLAELTEEIRDYERDLAPGSETALWGEYCDRMRQITGLMPWDDDAADRVIPWGESRRWLKAYEYMAREPNADLAEVRDAAGE